MNSKSYTDIDRVLPPLMWIWLGVLLYNIPFLDILFSAYPNFETPSQYPPIVLLLMLPLKFLAIISQFFSMSPHLLIFGIGWLIVMLPWTRKCYIERKYQLRQPPAMPEIQEIQSFTTQHGPHLEIHTNLTLVNDVSPMIYPLGYRKYSLAIFGGFILLWNRNRKAAEAMLLHEIGHYKAGDGFSLGAGSPFRFLITISPLLILLTILFDVAIGSFDVMLSIVSTLLAKSGQAIIPFIIRTSSSVLMEIIVSITEMVSNLSIPLLAIWCSELFADHFVAANPDHTPGVKNALHNSLGKAKSLRTVLFGALSHPPRKLRSWFINIPNDKKRLTLLLLSFPLTFLLSFVLEVLAVFLRFTSEFLFYDVSYSILWDGVRNVAIAAVNAYGIFPFVTAIFLLIWPLLLPVWQWFFCRDELHVPHISMKFPSYQAYLISAAILFVFAGGFAILRFILWTALGA